MQVSLNPLVATVIGEKNLESSLTFGQFVKAIASFVAPIIAAACAAKFGSWSIIFPVFAVVSLLSALWLGFTPIQEKITQTTQPSFIESISLLKNPAILLAFLGIMCHVGLDVGTNVTAPKILIERASMTLETAGYVTSIYFLFRTIGSFTGSFIMTKISSNKFFIFSVLLMLLGMGCLLFASNVTLVYVCVAMIGYGNSNIFPVIFARALQNMPEHQNSVSGLMIMGLFGGTVFPLVMGVASDAFGQIAAVAVMLVGAIYLMLFNKRIAA
jgi:fucose permease